jgi:dTDP-4-amino-4,6-dideoxygalactose transaminase
MVPFIDLKSQYAALKSDIDRNIQSVLDDGRYINGPALKQFEAELAEFSGAKHVLGCSSGTDALVIPLMAIHEMKGFSRDKPMAVFVPAFTYTASAEVIALVGAQPVFVDVDPKTFNMCAKSLDEQIQRIKAEGVYEPAVVMAVDLFGQPADYTALTPVADQHGLMMMCDSAQGLGGALDGKRVGSLGDVSGTSFFPAKPLGCYGDGGAIFTDNDEMAKIMTSIRTHGTGSHKYEVLRIGMNGRLDTLQAAVLSVKLAAFEGEIEARNTLADHYNAELSGLVETPYVMPNALSSWAQYVLKTDRREELQAHLKEKGIPTMVYYPSPMHFQIAYKHYGQGPGSMPVSEALCSDVMALPMHPYMDSETAKFITDSVKGFFKG